MATYSDSCSSLLSISHDPCFRCLGKCWVPPLLFSTSSQWPWPWPQLKRFPPLDTDLGVYDVPAEIKQQLCKFILVNYQYFIHAIKWFLSFNSLISVSTLTPIAQLISSETPFQIHNYNTNRQLVKLIFQYICTWFRP